MQPIYRLLLLLALSILPAVSQAQIYGCTDPAATNYNAAANHNDGSCIYPATAITAQQLGILSDTIKETSGLLYWNGSFWTHNDDTDTTLYALDTADGHIRKRIAIAGGQNHDWEELTQDNDYFYLGDFGNNGNGNRQDLVILRIEKALLLAGRTNIIPEKIFFSYADQTSFTPTGNNNTDFDCEAFIATSDSLYLFTKQWINGKTKLYRLPKIPGTFTATPLAEYNVDGLITGATYLAAKQTAILCGYKISGLILQPFVVLLYDFSGNNFFAGNKRRMLINPLYHQTEGIASMDGKQFYLTNEKLTQSGITITPKLQKIDLNNYLNTYYNSLAVSINNGTDPKVILYPNPAKEFIITKLYATRNGTLKIFLYSSTGQLADVQTHNLQAGTNEIIIHKRAGIVSGTYWMKLVWEEKAFWSKLMINE